MSTIEIGLIAGGCVLGLALSTFFLTFNIIHRHERYCASVWRKEQTYATAWNRVVLTIMYFTSFRYIKLSSPKLNNVMLIGAMHIHVSCLLFALDKWFFDHHLLGRACMVTSLDVWCCEHLLWYSYAYLSLPVASHWPLARCFSKPCGSIEYSHRVTVHCCTRR